MTNKFFDKDPSTLRLHDPIANRRPFDTMRGELTGLADVAELPTPRPFLVIDRPNSSREFTALVLYSESLRWMVSAGMQVSRSLSCCGLFYADYPRVSPFRLPDHPSERLTAHLNRLERFRFFVNVDKVFPDVQWTISSLTAYSWRCLAQTIPYYAAAHSRGGCVMSDGSSGDVDRLVDVLLNEEYLYYHDWVIRNCADAHYTHTPSNTTHRLCNIYTLSLPRSRDYSAGYYSAKMQQSVSDAVSRNRGYDSDYSASVQREAKKWSAARCDDSFMNAIPDSLF